MSLKQPVVSVLGEFESASSPNLVNSHADSEFTLSAPSRAYARVARRLMVVLWSGASSQDMPAPILG
jgi:hypothetical protein